MSSLLTVSQVATILQVSQETVVRRFARVKGVIDLGTAETRHKRRYRVLRISLDHPLTQRRIETLTWVLEECRIRLSTLIRMSNSEFCQGVIAHGYRIS
jgi:hypothetical protein